MNQGANFRAAISPDGIRLRHGLLETRAQTVPPGRVQAIRLTQGPLWRGKDWWRVEVNVAGYGWAASSSGTRVLLPVGHARRGADRPVARPARPRGRRPASRLLDGALDGVGDDAGFTGAPRSARWVDPVGWRRNGFRVTDRALVIRTGRFWRQVDVVPHERTQSLGLAAGPARSAGSVSRRSSLHSTPGPVAPRVDHLAAAVAAELLDEQAARARTARATRRRSSGCAPSGSRRRRPTGSARTTYADRPRPGTGTDVRVDTGAEPGDGAAGCGRRRPDAAGSTTGAAGTGRMSDPATRPGRLGVGVVGAGRVGAVLGSALRARGPRGRRRERRSRRRRGSASRRCCRASRCSRCRRSSSAPSSSCSRCPTTRSPDLVAGLADVGAWQAGPDRRAHVGPVRRRRARPGARGGRDPARAAPGDDVHGDVARPVAARGLLRSRSPRPAPVLPIGQALVVEIGGEPVVVDEDGPRALPRGPRARREPPGGARRAGRAGARGRGRRATRAGCSRRCSTAALDGALRAVADGPAPAAGPGAIAALTGPVSRGDVGTVREHRSRADGRSPPRTGAADVADGVPRSGPRRPRAARSRPAASTTPRGAGRCSTHSTEGSPTSAGDPATPHAAPAGRDRNDHADRRRRPWCARARSSRAALAVRTCRRCRAARAVAAHTRQAAPAGRRHDDGRAARRATCRSCAQAREARPTARSS